MKRILILMSRTGGGHAASARALKAAFEAHRPGFFHIEIVDFLTDYLPFPINRLPLTYDALVHRAPALWRLLWHVTAAGSVGPGLSRAVGLFARRRIERLLANPTFDLVLSVHPLVNHLAIPVLKSVAPHTPYMTVVTDLGSMHPLWFHPDARATFVPTEAAAARAAGNGLDRGKIIVSGLPIRAQFAAPKPDRARVRAEFGLLLEPPAILVVGGGGGVGPVADIVAHTADRLSAERGASDVAAQIAVVCGSNVRLHSRLAKRRWPVPVAVYGFVERMADLMHACDVIVTKAGPGTIAEAAICGLPMVLSGFIPGQEEGNIDYVVDNAAGVYVPRPKDIAETVAQLLGSDMAALAAMTARSKALGRPEATVAIARSIMDMIEEGSDAPPRGLPSVQSAHCRSG